MVLQTPEAIEKLLVENGCSFKKNAHSFVISSCPRCSKSNKLYIFSSGTCRFKCFYCATLSGFEGKPEYALSEILNIPVNEVKDLIYEADSLPNNPDGFINFNPAVEETDEELYSEYVLASIPYTPDIYPITSKQCLPGLKYLEGRGINTQLAVKYGIMYSPMARRVIFPVKYQGALHGWQARTISSNEEYFDDETGKNVKIIKALTSSGLKKDKTLMFRDNLINIKHCVLTEGPVDAIKADLCGGAVATMGKAVSKSQLEMIRSHGIRKVYLGLDPDAAAETRQILKYFSDLEVYDMRPKQAKDLGEMSLLEVKALFDRADRLDSSRIIVFLKNHY